jgi:hypothetical protein
MNNLSKGDKEYVVQEIKYLRRLKELILEKARDLEKLSITIVNFRE